MEVRLEGVWHSYDGVSYALRNVTLAFKGPGVHLIVGPNGSGKTTLLKIASFILKPSRGRVLVDGRDFWSLGEPEKAALRRMVGYVHDKPILVRGSVRYNLELGLRLRGEGDDRSLVEYAFRYRLLDVLDKPASALSAGQAKAVAIVRALALKPRLLALDEPFTFLDNYRVKLLLQDIERLSGETTIIIATHYMYRELEKIAGRKVEIIDGEVAGASNPGLNEV
jgi:ABC-type multidrug transport system ATPase subunit